jgi:hypothetical protein
MPFCTAFFLKRLNMARVIPRKVSLEPNDIGLLPMKRWIEGVLRKPDLATLIPMDAGGSRIAL